MPYTRTAPEHTDSGPQVSGLAKWGGRGAMINVAGELQLGRTGMGTASAKTASDGVIAAGCGWRSRSVVGRVGQPAYVANGRCRTARGDT